MHYAYLLSIKKIEVGKLNTFWKLGNVSLNLSVTNKEANNMSLQQIIPPNLKHVNNKSLWLRIHWNK